VSAFTEPSVQSDVVVISTGRNKSSLRTESLHELKSEHPAIEFERPVEVGNLQVHVANADSWINH
jgi:hypothetical protein